MHNVPAISQQPTSVLREGNGGIWWDDAAMMQAQKTAEIFASSQLVPKHLQGKVADCIIALGMAKEMNVNPLLVLQNIYFVSGKAGWSTQFMVARANCSGAIKGRITWKTIQDGTVEVDRNRQVPNISVTAYATLADGGDVIEATADMRMAVGEGWTVNPKYRSMPAHMLKWRSATMLIRLYLPEVMMGLHSVDELETVDLAPARVDVTPEVRVNTVHDEAAAAMGFEPDEVPGVMVDPMPAEERPPPAQETAAHRTTAKAPSTAQLKKKCADMESQIGPEMTSRIRERQKIPSGDIQRSKLRGGSISRYLGELMLAAKSLAEAEAPAPAPAAPAQDSVPAQPDWTMEERIERSQELRAYPTKDFWEIVEMITGLSGRLLPNSRDGGITAVLDIEYPMSELGQ